MSQISDEKDFEKLLRLAIPLIKYQNEPNFDRLLSKWMGKEINKEYLIWKESSRGSECPHEEQIRFLLTMWRKKVRDMANIKGFIEILQKAQGVSCKFEVGFGKCQNSNIQSSEFGLTSFETPSDDTELDEYATKIQSAYRGYLVRKTISSKSITNTKISFNVDKPITKVMLEFENSMQDFTTNLNLNTCATKIQKAYRTYRRRNVENKRNEDENKDLSI